MKLNQPQPNTNLRTIALAAFLGGLAGAAVLMFAPKYGQLLRQGLQNKVSNLSDRQSNPTKTKRSGYITLNSPRVTRADDPSYS